MRFRAYLLFVALVAAVAVPAHSEDATKFNDARYVSFEAPFEGYTGKNAELIKEFAVPIYIGIPDHPYSVFGRVYDSRNSGVSMLGKALSEGLFSERDRQRDCAAQARYQGGDALVVTGDEKTLKKLGLNIQDVESTAPLFQHKDKVALVVKFH
jgi:hypothetical protein